MAKAIPPSKVGQRLRKTRGEQGLSLEQLSRSSGVSVGYLSLIENQQRRPGEAVLTKLAGALDVPIAYLVGESRELLSENHPNLKRLGAVLESGDLSARTGDLLEKAIASLADLAEGLAGEPSEESALDQTPPIADLLNVVVPNSNRQS